MGRWVLCTIVTALALAAALGAQTAQPPARAIQPPTPQQQGTAPVAEQAPPAQESYTYDPAGRRDPFVSLVGTGVETRGTDKTKRGDGAASMAVAEISVRGIMQSRGSLVAMIMGPDNKTYIVPPGDRLLDGTIKSITPQGLIVIQEVNDPLSLVKQREVSKLLRSAEGAK